MHEIVEHGWFYRTSDHTWVTIKRIQFVGACNPPTDPGRKPLSHRYGWALIRNVCLSMAEGDTCVNYVSCGTNMLYTFRLHVHLNGDCASEIHCHFIHSMTKSTDLLFPMLSIS